MINIFGVNGLVVWDEREIKLREFYIDYIGSELYKAFYSINRAWSIERIESSTLIPLNLVNKNYTQEDFYKISDELALRPETTAGSYLYAKQKLKSSKLKVPAIIWQAGKSFRIEQDKTVKNMRLKEFYQMEFQCIYAESTMNDYFNIAINNTARIISTVLNKNISIEPSDRLPSYSSKTIDLLVKNDGSNLELASISLRTDFDETITFKKIEKLLVVEVAIGIDRLVYSHFSNQD